MSRAPVARRRHTPDPRATELDCETTIIQGARILGYLVHGERPARTLGQGWVTPIKGDAGWPDLVIAGHGHCLVVELKRRPRKVDAAQQTWLDVLAAAGVTTGVVWVPEGVDAFLDELAGLAQKGRRI